MNTTALKKYKSMVMLPADLDEKLVEEFSQKFYSEIQRLDGSVQHTSRQRHHMVKTKMNRGHRNVHMLLATFEAPARSIGELNRYLRLAQNTVVNFAILVDQTIAA